MAQLTVKADNPISEDLRLKTLKHLQDTLSDTELQRLGEIAKSPKARKYLNDKYGQVKFFFGIK